MDLVLDENVSFSLTPQFIEVLERTSIGANCVNSFSGRSNKPLKRFQITRPRPTPTERGVLMRTRLAHASQWIDVKSPPSRSPTDKRTAWSGEPVMSIPRTCIISTKHCLAGFESNASRRTFGFSLRCFFVIVFALGGQQTGCPYTLRPVGMLDSLFS